MAKEKALTRPHRKRLAKINRVKRAQLKGLKGLRLKLKKPLQVKSLNDPTQLVTLPAGDYPAERVDNPMGENKPSWIVAPLPNGELVGATELYLTSKVVQEDFEVVIVESEEETETLTEKEESINAEHNSVLAT
jgi:hypothetical protein